MSLSTVERERRAVLAAVEESGGCWRRSDLYNYRRTIGGRNTRAHGTGDTFALVRQLVEDGRLCHTPRRDDEPERWFLPEAEAEAA